MIKWFKNLRIEWQIAIFTVVVGAVGGIIGLLMNTRNSSTPQTTIRQNGTGNTAIVAKGNNYITYNVYNSQPEMQKLDNEHGQDFKKDFPLGYKLFAIANRGEFFPFQGTAEVGFLVHWDRRNYKWESDGDNLIFHLPDIDILPNIMMHELTIKLPNEVGASLSLNIDARSYKYGMAIVNNTFEFIPTKGSSLTSFDASFVQDGAVIAYNRFSSRSGIFNIGPHPELSFVVEIIQIGTNGAVMLFGAKPYE
jgi:hypothetical protein